LSIPLASTNFRAINLNNIARIQAMKSKARAASTDGKYSIIDEKKPCRGSTNTSFQSITINLLLMLQNTGFNV